MLFDGLGLKKASLNATDFFDLSPFDPCKKWLLRACNERSSIQPKKWVHQVNPLGLEQNLSESQSWIFKGIEIYLRHRFLSTNVFFLPTLVKYYTIYIESEIKPLTLCLRDRIICKVSPCWFHLLFAIATSSKQH